MNALWCRGGEVTLSGAVTCGANAGCSNQRATRRKTPVRERRVPIATTKEFGSFSKQAHKLPIAFAEFLEQPEIRRMAKRARGSIRSPRSSTPALGKHLLAAERPASRPAAFLTEFAFSGFDPGSDLISRTGRLVGSVEGADEELPPYTEGIGVRSRFSAQPGCTSSESIRIAVDPGHRDLLRLLLRGKDHHAGPLACTFRKAGFHGVDDDVDESIEESPVIQYGFGGVATFEAGSSAFADAVDRPGEVSEEVARPCSEFSILIPHDEREVVGEDTDGEDLYPREMLLCAGQPLEDSLVDLWVWAEEEAGLMTSGSD